MALGLYPQLTVIVISNRHSVLLQIAFLSFALHLHCDLLVLLLLQESLIQSVDG